MAAMERASQTFYKDSFDPKDYYQEYFSEECAPVVENFLTNLHHVFHSDLVKNLTGRKVLELGSGPTITYLLSASDWSADIIASDYAPNNVEELRRWRSKDQDALSFLRYAEFVTKLEGKSDAGGVEERLRKSIRDIIFCDVLNSNPIAPRDERFDVVMASLVLEATSKDPAAMKSSLKHMTSLLNAGGILILQGYFNSSYWENAGQRFSVLCVDSEMLSEALEEANLKIVWRKDWNSGFIIEGSAEMIFYTVVTCKM